MKDWTILIYANGNNEMEPEMYRSMIDCEKIGSNDSVDVIIQLARADRKIAEIMRPNKRFAKEEVDWNGARRYYVSKSNSNLIESLDGVNMAHPDTLYQFIKWGIEKYPAKHYMVILSGHGISFVGNMTDLTFDVPYIMGTPEMCMAIDLIHKNLGIELDILVLDMCYMNSIEIIYEFGKKPVNGVKNILTYIGEGPFEGMPYDIIISAVQKNSTINSIETLLRDLINSFNSNTIAFDINHNKLNSIKNQFNDLAYCYLKNNSNYNIESYALFNETDPSYPWHNLIMNLGTALNSIITYYKEVDNEEKSLIKVISEDLGNLINIYCKLAFAKNNYWTHLLCNREVIPSVEINFKPMKLSKESIIYSILTTNPNLSREEAQLILNKMLTYKK